MANSRAGQLAGKALDYLIGANGPLQGDEDRVTETPFAAPPAARGVSIAYCNLRREEGEPPAYGPYLEHDDIFREYGEGRPDPSGKGFRRNLLEQLDLCSARSHASRAGHPDVSALRGSARHQPGAGTRARRGRQNPKLTGRGAVEYVLHPNIFGIIVEKGAGSADDHDQIRRASGKPDLPVWFVHFDEGRSDAKERKKEIIKSGYRNMGVTYSPRGEYGSSEDVLLPRIADIAPRPAASMVGSNMVWKGDGNARLAKSLVILIDQVDAQFPVRDRSSDGTLGDTNHQARPSDHNPDGERVVRALDISHDPAHGVDTYRIAEILRVGRDPRIKYVISNRRIFRPR